MNHTNFNQIINIFIQHLSLFDVSSALVLRTHTHTNAVCELFRAKCEGFIRQPSLPRLRNFSFC